VRTNGTERRLVLQSLRKRVKSEESDACYFEVNAVFNASRAAGGEYVNYKIKEDG